MKQERIVRSDNISKWLKNGEQSKIKKKVIEIISEFIGSDFEKVMSILSWKNKNLKRCTDQEKVVQIFATRNVSEVLKEMMSTGCHDDALIVATFCRAVGIPAKYVIGINKLDPKNRGHCVVELFLHDRWILVDQSRGSVFIYPERSDFYRMNFIIGKGLDSWDLGISSFKTWEEKSNRIIDLVNSF
ncbi:MAG: transglutaminase-like domain-containing protein [Candidatus Cloacimonadota bacterium]|nr:transglutaminase-like domain-containing protein [Candidatus Cloacimonadota bacterium]